MSKINSITLSNFKFFGKEETIELGGKHLLLYGENGSGKSSIYWALYTLLEAARKTTLETGKYFVPLSYSADSLLNIHATKESSPVEHYNSYIRILDDGNHQYELSLWRENVCGNSNIMESRLSSEFINYQSLYKFQDFKNSEDPDLYNIFINTILSNESFGTYRLKGKILDNAYEMWVEFQDGPGTTVNSKGETIQVYKNSQQYIDFVDMVSGFNRGMNGLINDINSNAQKYVNSLGYNMSFHLEYKEPTFKKKDKKYEWTPFGIRLTITKYDGVDVTVERPHKFLNEARMSAIAIAIRLSIIKRRIGASAPDALKLLLLDDIMISLDMSNRDKLLKLFLCEFTKDFQVLLFTHDKRLYEYIGHRINIEKQKKNWITYEMYSGIDAISKHEVPIIIKSECEFIDKAKKFFYVSKDYSSCAINLRKALEMEIGNRLPIELKKRAIGGYVDLQTLWDKLKEYYSNNKYHDSKKIKPIDDLFKESKLFILNPSAHYQSLSNPIYRSELEKAFLLYSEVAALPIVHRELKISKDSYVLCSISAKKYTCGFYLDDDLIVVEGEHIISRMPKCYKIFWEYNGIEYYNFVTGVKDLTNPLIKSTPKLDSFISRLPLGIDEQTFLSNCRINGIPINDYLGGVKISSLIVQSAKP